MMESHLGTTGEMLVIYNVSVGKDEVKYQLKDKKKAPWETIKKSEIFMILNSDGTTTLYNNNYQKKQKSSVSTIKSQQSTPTTLIASSAKMPESKTLLTSASPSTQVAPSVAGQQLVTANMDQAKFTPASPSTQVAPSVAGQQLVTANMDQTKFTPASPEMSPTDLEIAVNTVNPYTLYRKGSMAEYGYEYKGKPFKVGFIKINTPTSGYLRQIVEDEKIVNGQLVAYIRQEEYNSKHEPSKWMSDSYKQRIFPTEIDPSGTFHLTHNLHEDNLTPIGYCLLIPGNMQPGMQLQSSTLYDSSKSAVGTFRKETMYSNWQVVGEEQLETPAGTFNCIKLTGKISQKYNREKKYTEKNVICWMARGIGIVRYEVIIGNGEKPGEGPLIIYLNAIDLK